MIKKTYSEKLLDPRWQKRRLEIFERDGFCCKKCGDDEETLHVHHRYYLNKLDPWEYSSSALITLCKPCHESETEYKNALRTLGIDNFLNSQFLPSEIYSLSAIMAEVPYIQYHPETVMEIIKYALQSKILMEFLGRKYFEAHPNEK